MTAAMASQATGTDAVVGRGAHLPEPLLRGLGPVPHHLRPQRHRLPLRAAGAGELLGARMALTTPATVGPRVAERSVRDQLTRGGADWAGTIFVVLLLASLGFSILVLATLMVDVLQTGMPVLARALRRLHDRHRLRTQADESGLYQGLVGSFWICAFVVAARLPARDRRRPLPRGVRRRHRLQPVREREHPQPGRRPVDRLRHPRPHDLHQGPPGDHRPGHGQRPHDHVGRAHPRHPRAPDRDHHRLGGGAGRAQRPPGGGLRRRRHPLGGDPGPRAARTRPPGSSPA